MIKLLEELKKEELKESEKYIELKNKNVQEVLKIKDQRIEVLEISEKNLQEELKFFKDRDENESEVTSNKSLLT